MTSLFKKKREAKLELLTYIDMLLMVGKGTGGAICHSIHRHKKASNKYLESYDKNVSHVFRCK